MAVKVGRDELNLILEEIEKVHKIAVENGYEDCIITDPNFHAYLDNTQKPTGVEIKIRFCKRRLKRSKKNGIN